MGIIQLNKPVRVKFVKGENAGTIVTFKSFLVQLDASCFNTPEPPVLVVTASFQSLKGGLAKSVGKHTTVCVDKVDFMKKEALKYRDIVLRCPRA